MKKFIFLLIGIILMLAGLIGVIMPILPGWPLLLIGLSFIAPRLAAKLRVILEGRFFKKRMLSFEEWPQSGVRAGITTRHFPLCIGKTDELGNPEVQARLKERLLKEAAFKERGGKDCGRFVFLNQVHGDRIAVLEDAKNASTDSFQLLPGTDAVITNIKKLNLIVLTADCLSVYLWAGDWVGLVHAGWRGTQKHITAKTYALIRKKSGHSEVKIIFGPCIRKENYEVGVEFKKYFKESLSEKDGKLYFDLAGENERQLLAAGAIKENILDIETCTIAENNTFYSFRKEKEAAGRMISFIRKN